MLFSFLLSLRFCYFTARSVMESFVVDNGFPLSSWQVVRTRINNERVKIKTRAQKRKKKFEPEEGNHAKKGKANKC